MSTIRVYADLPDTTLIIDVPAGELTPAYVAQARESGGVRVRIHALDAEGRTIDRVLVR